MMTDRNRPILNIRWFQSPDGVYVVCCDPYSRYTTVHTIHVESYSEGASRTHWTGACRRHVRDALSHQLTASRSSTYCNRWTFCMFIEGTVNLNTRSAIGRRGERSLRPTDSQSVRWFTNVDEDSRGSSWCEDSCLCEARRACSSSSSKQTKQVYSRITAFSLWCQGHWDSTEPNGNNKMRHLLSSRFILAF